MERVSWYLLAVAGLMFVFELTSRLLTLWPEDHLLHFGLDMAALLVVAVSGTLFVAAGRAAGMPKERDLSL